MRPNKFTVTVYKVTLFLRSGAELAILQDYLFCNKLIFPDFIETKGGNCQYFPVSLVLLMSLERMNVILNKIQNHLVPEQVVVTSVSIPLHRLKHLLRCEAFFERNVRTL